LKLPIPDSHAALPPDAAYVAGTSLSALANLRPLGQIHDSFIVAAGRDGLWLIDQHVAHERILFEKVLRGRAEGKLEVQSLLMPMIIELTPAQMADYNRIAAELKRDRLRDRAVRAAQHRYQGRAVGRPARRNRETGVRDPGDCGPRNYGGYLWRMCGEESRRRWPAAPRSKINTPPRRAQKWPGCSKSWRQTNADELSARQAPSRCLYSTRDILKGFHRV
jgi:DNA mismatch repair protein MutL